ncbi:methyltransferase domain-containing protein [uncultured Lamprocystis sp.]|jgi:SAM-dependent methyltransferase|uniref:methyltransferase domain-containing protein n=2 Tax=uncultured Lamprocystis sp. TaxID=543132 RepID=UPI0025EA540E|nr:methyltransferase domain-containing protein [uncultured Lamprocystis sp.]
MVGEGIDGAGLWDVSGRVAQPAQSSTKPHIFKPDCAALAERRSFIMFAKNAFYFLAGLGFLALAKAKHTVKGYSSPKPFDMSQTQRCIDYDIKVVDEWLSHLQRYSADENPIVGKNALELGPGSDLGIGIYLLSLGCAKYNACDVNDLVKITPDIFYEKLFEHLGARGDAAKIDFLREQLAKAKAGIPGQLNYVVRKDFDIVAAFGKNSIDLVFSQAAFEHFDDVHKTVEQLSAVCKPNAVVVLEIDLKTHSRWIRDNDPNNIYRYPSWLYNLFWFRGIPNRVRPYQYVDALKRCGWTDISLRPSGTVKDPVTAYSGLAKVFSDHMNQMEMLTITLCARKS